MRTEVVVGTKSLESMLAELEASGRRVPATANGVTVDELVTASGWSCKRVRDQLRRAIAVGTWEHAGSRATTRMDGRASLTPVYRPVKRKR